jgi:kynureninase
MKPDPIDPNLSRLYAEDLDSRDPLAVFRDQFVISDPDLIYLDGNSLGRLTRSFIDRNRLLVEQEWGGELVGGWNKGWWEEPVRLGEKIARLVGAATGQLVACDNVSINLFKLAAAALSLRPERSRIVTDTLNFPSDLYILQGLVRLLDKGHSIVRIGSLDDDIHPDLETLAAAIDENTAMVTLSHVTFKSGYLYDMAAVTQLAHRQGALVLWDLSHSAGALPVALDACNADFAIGCTYKYLNGGPGSPAFLYVRNDLQERVLSPINGWWGQNAPFAFDLDYLPAPGIARFLSGTPPILSLIALEASLEPLLEAGMQAIRTKSVQLGEYLVALADARLGPLGFILGSPRLSQQRGSHISLRHPEGYRINRVLIEQMKVIPDFRMPDNLRLGLAPLYTSFCDIWQAVDRIRQVAEEKLYEKYPLEHLRVT